ncbi:MAG: biofilm regulation protein phosphatase SiaA [Inhella sp.]
MPALPHTALSPPAQRLGLRGKSLLALFLSSLLALGPAFWLGWQVVDSVRAQLGSAYARDTVLLKREQVAGLLSRELALSLRQARSEATRQWLLAEDDPQARATFWREAASFRQDFASRAFSITPAQSLNYYFQSDDKPGTEPLERLRPDAEKDSWFFNTLKSERPYNINVDVNHQVGATRVWINVLVRDAGRALGSVGASLDLGELTRRLVSDVAPGQQVLIVNRSGAIQIDRDLARIALNSGTQSQAARDHTIEALLDSPADIQAVRTALARAEAEPGSAQVVNVNIRGVPELLASAYIPDLDWHVVSTLDLRVAPLLRLDTLVGPLIAIGLLGLGLFLGIALSVERLILAPLRQLKRSAQAIADGHYEVTLPAPRADEIGDLTRAFGTMASQVRGHTESLEREVQARTRELEQANRDMAQAHRAISDSIDYARLIQRAILPDRQLEEQLGSEHFVLWQPRDVVGGDFYVFRTSAEGELLGVVDCAGHGVPGALMTMLARSAIDHALEEVGLTDPATLLHRIDASIRSMLVAADIPRTIATTMDVGLVHIDRQAQRARFAGAKVSLFRSDGRTVEEIKPGRRALNETRRGQYENVEFELSAGTSYYLVTDGFLDQAGGEHGFGFGNQRFAELVREHAALPPGQQREAFVSALRRYQGGFAQRDDITVMCFRVDQGPKASQPQE